MSKDAAMRAARTIGFSSFPFDFRRVLIGSSFLDAPFAHDGPAVKSRCGLHNRDRVRNTGVVRTYGQYCPIAVGAEIFAERWAPLIIGNLYLGRGNFSEILEGAPGLSRTVLSQRPAPSRAPQVDMLTAAVG
jgi:hypothetical protein